MSHPVLRAAALEFDLGCALHRLRLSGNGQEIMELELSQLEALYLRVPHDNAARAAIMELINGKRTEQPNEQADPPGPSDPG